MGQSVSTEEEVKDTHHTRLLTYEIAYWILTING